MKLKVCPADKICCFLCDKCITGILCWTFPRITKFMYTMRTEKSRFFFLLSSIRTKLCCEADKWYGSVAFYFSYDHVTSYYCFASSCFLFSLFDVVAKSLIYRTLSLIEIYRLNEFYSLCTITKPSKLFDTESMNN